MLAPASARADELDGAVLAGGTVDAVGGAGWWAAAEAWFGAHGARVDAFGERGAVLLEGSYQVMAGNAWPNLVAGAHIGGGADVRGRPVAPVVAAGGELLVGLGLPRPLALAARFDAHCLFRDGTPYFYVTVSLGIGAAF